MSHRYPVVYYFIIFATIGLMFSLMIWPYNISTHSPSFVLFALLLSLMVVGCKKACYATAEATPGSEGTPTAEQNPNSRTFQIDEFIHVIRAPVADGGRGNVTAPQGQDHPNTQNSTARSDNPPPYEEVIGSQQEAPPDYSEVMHKKKEMSDLPIVHNQTTSTTGPPRQHVYITTFITSSNDRESTNSNTNESSNVQGTSNLSRSSSS